ncbi:MAG: hypothetical protein LBT46_11715 [Planctomycetaceae bacterium]|jgi:hypothetical protein|nr:hypothetical protein [Planctomycetaceae bacterium]
MNIKPLCYSVWMTVDRKVSIAVLGSATAGTALCVWYYSGWMTTLAALVLMLLTVWYVIVPIQFEINAGGIIRTVFGRHWFIAWNDIKGYQIRQHGFLLLPQNDRFALEAFTGFYLPVPAGLMPEVLYRFRLFIGE